MTAEEVQNLPEILTVDETAALLRVNRKSIYEAIKNNQFPGVLKIGKSLRISKAAVLHSMHSQGRDSQQE